MYPNTYPTQKGGKLPVTDILNVKCKQNLCSRVNMGELGWLKGHEREFVGIRNYKKGIQQALAFSLANCDLVMQIIQNNLLQ